MRTILVAAVTAAALSLPGAAFAQTSGQSVVPSSEHMNSSHANAPSTSGLPGYSTGGPRATPISETQVKRHRARMVHPIPRDANAANETNSSQPTGSPR